MRRLRRSRVGRLVREERRIRSFGRKNPSVARVIRGVEREYLTYIPREALIELAEAVNRVEGEGRRGSIVEAGTALGGSGIVLAAAKARKRPMRLYDTFGMIPPPSGKDGEDVHRRYAEIAEGRSSGIGGDIYYGYREDLLADVRESFMRYGLEPYQEGIEFIQGRYEEVMNIDYPVAFAHVDCDWYSSVKVCLEQLNPHLVPGATVVIDDYDTWSGCSAAVDEFLSVQGGYRSEKRMRLHLIKE